RSAALTAQKYQFQIAKDELFKDILIDQQVPQPQLSIPPQPQLSIPPQPPGTYYVRIRSIDGDGFIGPFSQAQVLEIPEGGLYYWLLLLPLLALIAL
ncbi:MAG: hypothetical protein ABL925_09840, partial [Methylococcales bacterium]